MLFEFEGKIISGVLSVLPENEYIFEEENIDPQDIKNRRLKRIIGFGKRRRVKADTTLSEMLLYGMRYLMDHDMLQKEQIGAIVVSTLSQDFLLPQISMILHGELGLSPGVFCIDSPQACGGFVVGLLEAFKLLEHMQDRKVILCTGEIFNRRTNPNEPKLEHPSFGGDIANIAVLENTSEHHKIYANAYSDGSQRNALLIRDGGFKYPMTEEKLKAQINHSPIMGVEMDGSAVFNFVQKEVPPAIEELLEMSKLQMDEIDYFLFHQPNKFMLQKLAEKLGVPYSKIPMNITEELGNSDSGTIPAVMTFDLSKQLTEKQWKCCLSGFGGGLSWTSMLMDIGPLDFCESIDSPF